MIFHTMYDFSLMLSCLKQRTPEQASACVRILYCPENVMTFVTFRFWESSVFTEVASWVNTSRSSFTFYQLLLLYFGNLCLNRIMVVTNTVVCYLLTPFSQQLPTQPLATFKQIQWWHDNLKDSKFLQVWKHCALNNWFWLPVLMTYPLSPDK